MKILFIDTETTGISLDFNSYPTDTEKWPRMVSFAYILSDENEKIIEEGTFKIKPSKFLIPVEATKVHGISTADALENGIDLGDALNKISKLVSACDLIVGHNVQFDINTVDAEFFRMYGDRCPLNAMPRICTMKSSAEYCNLRNGKYPKLVELYNILYGHDFVNAHDALSDTKATFECFWLLVKLNVIEWRKDFEPGRFFAKAPMDWDKGYRYIREQSKFDVILNLIWTFNITLNKNFYSKNPSVHSLYSLCLIKDYKTTREIEDEYFGGEQKINTIEEREEKNRKFLNSCLCFIESNYSNKGTDEIYNEINRDRKISFIMPKTSNKFIGFGDKDILNYLLQYYFSVYEDCSESFWENIKSALYSKIRERNNEINEELDRRQKEFSSIKSEDDNHEPEVEIPIVETSNLPIIEVFLSIVIVLIVVGLLAALLGIK